MAENSKIEWTNHTMNFWLGCTALSPACDHCYAEGWAKRTGQSHLWAGERRRTSAALWRQPLKWNAACETAGIRQRVFTNSLADFFDNQVPADWRHDAWSVIGGTRHLDWMLLTKRPENITKMLPVMDSSAPGYKPWNERWPWRNVWLGTTIEDRARLHRLDKLRAVPAAVRFLSIEPLLEDLGEMDLTGIHLVIGGGESGPKARITPLAAARRLHDQCSVAGVPFFWKQNGEWLAWGQTLADGNLNYLSFGKDPSRFQYLGDGEIVSRVGKKAAGRLLDGVEHNGMPSPIGGGDHG